MLLPLYMADDLWSNEMRWHFIFLYYYTLYTFICMCDTQCSTIIYKLSSLQLTTSHVYMCRDKMIGLPVLYSFTFLVFAHYTSKFEHFFPFHSFISLSLFIRYMIWTNDRECQPQAVIKHENLNNERRWWINKYFILFSLLQYQTFIY